MPDRSISVSIDSNILVGDGEVIYLSAPVKLINDKTYIPIVDLEKVLNYSIYVDENLKRIYMIKKQAFYKSEFDSDIIESNEVMLKRCSGSVCRGRLFWFVHFICSIFGQRVIEYYKSVNRR